MIQKALYRMAQSFFYGVMFKLEQKLLLEYLILKETKYLYFVLMLLNIDFELIK
jgi:hypothetical protein